MEMKYLKLGSSAAASQDINYEQSNIGDNPVINLATGRLQYFSGDCSIGAGNYGINIAHVYNSKLNSTFASKFACFGKNWKLNLSQYMQVDSSKKQYIDEAGEIHSFVYLDSGRMYEENNAKIVLQTLSDGYVISDGAGNKKYFNSNGYLFKSVSCHGSSIVKLYNYDAYNRLVSVYDQRTVRANVAKHRIELTYNSSGYLDSMTAYINSTQKISGYKYSYDSSGNLIAIHRIAYNGKSQEMLSKQIVEFCYKNNLLSMIINSENNSAQSFGYNNGRITRVSSGVVQEESIAAGMKDSASNSIRLGSYIKGGMLFGRTYHEKSYNTYQYNYLSSTDDIAVEADVTNECGVTLAYFIDRLARIVSTFEKDGTSLKTLNLHKEKVACSEDPSTLGKINNNGIVSTSTYSCTVNPVRLVKPDNVPVQKSVSFSYSFWLKLNKSYNLLEVQASYCKKSETSNVTTTKVRVNSKAVGAWQKVTLSLILPQVTVSTDLYSLTIKFLSNGTLCSDKFQICDIGYIAAPTSELCLRKSDGVYLPLRALQKVKINGAETNIAQDFYLTEADIIATYMAKRSNSTFDVIHNDGTKRRSGVTSINYYLVTAWSNYTGNSPFQIITTLPAKDAHSYSTYTFENSTFSIENKFTKTVDGTQYNSTTKAQMDYLGKTLNETDEYGVITTNTYDSYGNLLKQVVSKGSTTYSAYNYTYYEGKLSSVSDGLTGQKISYDNGDNIKQVKEKSNVNGTMQSSDHIYQNIIGVFQDKTVAAVEYDGAQQVGKNTITYESGAIRTVSDGLAKYGVQYDLKNNAVIYSQFDGVSEKIIQKDTVSNYSSNNKSAVKTHQSQFFNQSGNVIDAANTKVDCYGNTTQKIIGGSTYNYTYNQGVESNFAKQIFKTTNPDGSNVEYKYNDEKEVVGWKEQQSSTKLLEVQQIAENKTKYTYGNNDEEYFVETEHDIEKMAAPHVTSVIFEQDTSASNDRNATEIFRSDYSWDVHELSQVQDRKRNSANGQFTNIAKTNYTYKSCMGNRLLEKMAFDNYDINSSVRTTASDSLQYYDNGLLKQETFSHDSKWMQSLITKKSNSATSTRTYQYDNLHRLQKEINSNLGINRTYSYRADGRLSSIGGLALTYDSRGRMTAYNGRKYAYDHYGNRISKTVNGVTTNYTYKCGNILTKAGNTEYTYNIDGVRYKKVTNGQTTRYYLDGNKILGEDRPSYKLRYFYDATGLKMIRRIGGSKQDYYCIKDSQGSIVLLVDNNRYIACRYEYDALGNCTILHDPDGIGAINPFRWKGLYLDSETNLYYANGSYYDPETMLYADAQDISSVEEKAFDARGLDRNGIVCNNTLELAGNPATMATTIDLSSDYEYDPGKTWWEKLNNCWRSVPNWLKMTIGAALIALSVAIMFCIGGATLAAAAEAAKTALVELSIGIGFATVGWVISSATSGDWNTGALENSIADAVFFTGVFMFVSASINAIKYLHRTKSLSRYSPEFLEWLNKGEANYTVYKGIGTNGDDVYTGITKQSLKKRLGQHQRAGKPFVDLKPYNTGLTRNQARAIETYKILTDGTSQVNQILSISRQHEFFNDAMKWAKIVLGG